MSSRIGRAASLVFAVLALAFVLFLAMAIGAIASGITAPNPEAGSPPAGASAALATVACCLLIAAVFTWLVLRSRLTGWRLVASVFLAYYGLGTVLLQIESAVFLPDKLPAGFVTRLFVMGALAGLLFAPAAATIAGRIRAPLLPGGPAMGISAVAGRIAVLAVAYMAVYFLAGYYIAYRNPELVAYYGGVDPGSFLGELQYNWQTAPWLFPLQIARGAFFVLAVLPFLLSFRGRRLELSLLVGATYAVWALMLLQPNAFMPESIRMSHLAEILASNFVFGCLVGAAFSTAAPRSNSGTARAW